MMESYYAAVQNEQDQRIAKEAMMDELKNALADAEQAHILAAEEHAQAEIAYYATLMRRAQAESAVEAAKSALLAAVCQTEAK